MLNNEECCNLAFFVTIIPNWFPGQDKIKLHHVTRQLRRVDLGEGLHNAGMLSCVEDAG